MRPIVITTSVLSDDANGIAEDQTTAGAGNLILNGALESGGVATAAEAQIVSIEGTGDNSGIDFTVTGTDADSKTQSQTIDGANNGTASTTAFFKTVTQISTDGAITGNVEAGWLEANGGVSKSIPTDRVQSPYNQALFVNITGSLTVTVQHTESDPFGVFANTFSTDATWRSTTGLTSVIANAEGNIAFPVSAVRLNMESGTGTSVFTSQQGG